MLPAAALQSCLQKFNFHWSFWYRKAVTATGHTIAIKAGQNMGSLIYFFKHFI